MGPLLTNELAWTEERLDNALLRLESLVRECHGLLSQTRVLAGLPPLDAVDHLLHRLGDEAPVDDFEAGRRRDRRLLPRGEPAACRRRPAVTAYSGRPRASRTSAN